MKFFIFACLLAVALAKHEIKPCFSSEESASIEQEKCKKDRNVIFQANQVSSSSSSSEESADIVTENKIEPTRISQEETLKKIVDLMKINQFPTFAIPNYFQIIHPQRIAVNSWAHIKNIAYPYIPIVRNF
ncbi:hypothetical protein H1C71_037101 [Ictidomys tridecemlineatus]|uniref:Alpha-S2-casein n=1 Tax=Ictidomys tridecemlineatus TaxID=43179 RepID=A0A287CT92_ICTTR|nr:hypothetical protein H1C71_037101 [Ictidomys tridecemlineatus]